MDKRYFVAYRTTKESSLIPYVGTEFHLNNPTRCKDFQRVEFERISKTELIRRLKSGPVECIVTGTNVNNYHILNGWHLGFCVTIQDRAGLDDLVSNWSYYNSCHETGYYPAFYVVRE